jgi:hypothetical protein
VNGDAPHIATMVFGDAKNHPDDDVYRQKFMSGNPEDRQWLQGEARRDPEQFLKVAERIGAKIPEPQPPAPQPTPPPAVVPPPQAPPGQGILPPAPLVAPGPVVVPALPNAPGQGPGMPPPRMPGLAPPPVILGPNGQPLPPSGLV